MPELKALIYQHGNDDYEIWFPDLPKEVVNDIEAILDRYVNRGYSVRGTANEIKDELI